MYERASGEYVDLLICNSCSDVELWSRGSWCCSSFARSCWKPVD